MLMRKQMQEVLAVGAGQGVVLPAAAKRNSSAIRGSGRPAPNSSNEKGSPRNVGVERRSGVRAVHAAAMAYEQTHENTSGCEPEDFVNCEGPEEDLCAQPEADEAHGLEKTYAVDREGNVDLRERFPEAKHDEQLSIRCEVGCQASVGEGRDDGHGDEGRREDNHQGEKEEAGRGDCDHVAGEEGSHYDMTKLAVAEAFKDASSRDLPGCQMISSCEDGIDNVAQYKEGEIDLGGLTDLETEQLHRKLQVLAQATGLVFPESTS